MLQHKSILSLVVLFFVLSGNACKMNYSMTGASISPEVKTISIQFFQNNSSLAPPILGQRFTDALRSTFLTQTSLKNVTKGGDLNFSGSITNYYTEAQSIQSNQTAATNRLHITVSVKFENKIDEKQNFESSFSRFADFPSGKTLLEVQDQLIKEIDDQLTQDIFNKALTNW